MPTRGGCGICSFSTRPSAIKLRKADRGAIEHKAEEILERVIADYGDVVYVNGEVATKETLAAVANRELSEIRSLSVGKKAPEITGEDVDGKPMKLSEFRGKVVLLDFGSHEHCGGCKLVYPRLRSTLDRLRSRPFVILGINNMDQREPLKQAIGPRRDHLAMLVGWRQARRPRADHHELEHPRLSHVLPHRPPRRDPLQERHPPLRHPVFRQCHRGPVK